MGVQTRADRSWAPGARAAGPKLAADACRTGYWRRPVGLL